MSEGKITSENSSVRSYIDRLVGVASASQPDRKAMIRDRKHGRVKRGYAKERRTYHQGEGGGYGLSEIKVPSIIESSYGRSGIDEACELMTE